MADEEMYSMSRLAPQKRAEVHVRQKALQPEERFCRILRKRVCVLVEYPDYRSPYNKGTEGELYCENIINCYQNNIQCRYSGISPMYPDPFDGVPRDVREAERIFGTAENPREPEVERDYDEEEEDEPAAPAAPLQPPPPQPQTENAPTD